MIVIYLKHVLIHMERTVGTHAVYTVPTRLVTDLTEVASQVVLTDFTANLAKEVMMAEKL